MLQGENLKSNNFFIQNFLSKAIDVVSSLSVNEIDKLITNIEIIKNLKGRIFFCGVGGSAGNANHAVNDFRKLAGIESYSATDNVSELTARVNDESWESFFVEYLKISNLNERDAIFILSVGGGSLQPEVSKGLIYAIDYTKTKNAKVLGIVGRDGGYTNEFGDSVVVIPPLHKDSVTQLTESIAVLVWHLIVTDPRIKQNETKW